MIYSMVEMKAAIANGDKKALARCITMVENDLDGADAFLKSLSNRPSKPPIIGITGPPGAGKSSLLNVLVETLTKENKCVGVLAVDPTSPFSFGSILGDRLRLSEQFNNDKVFIRSLATRGALGGLSAKTIEITDVMRCFPFDYIFIETVGVGQNEVEIAGLADITVLVLVPESGDDIQTLKSGIMEIADLFVINKSDREGADVLAYTLTGMANFNKEVFQVSATHHTGISALIERLKKDHPSSSNEKLLLLCEKAYRLIQSRQMKGINKKNLMEAIDKAYHDPLFNLYQFAAAYPMDH